jgi:hypothetical protein
VAARMPAVDPGSNKQYTRTATYTRRDENPGLRLSANIFNTELCRHEKPLRARRVVRNAAAFAHGIIVKTERWEDVLMESVTCGLSPSAGIDTTSYPLFAVNSVDLYAMGAHVNVGKNTR